MTLKSSNLEEKSDRELLRIISSGSKRNSEIAFTKLYQRYCGFGISICISLGGNREDGEEIFQDTLYIIYQLVRNQSDQEINNFRPYLHQSLKNNYYRSIKRGRKINLGDFSLTLAGDDEGIRKFEEKDQQKHILSIGLSQDQHPLMNDLINQDSVEELADTHDLSQDQVRGRIYRMRKRFRKLRKQVAQILLGY
ncbi:MAG: sigma-70 family RNA polymerase sigma factor [Saprospiraceae bacterium]